MLNRKYIGLFWLCIEQNISILHRLSMPRDRTHICYQILNLISQCRETGKRKRQHIDLCWEQTQVKKQVASNSVLGHKDDPRSHQILVTTGNAVIGMSIFGKGSYTTTWYKFLSLPHPQLWPEPQHLSKNKHHHERRTQT